MSFILEALRRKRPETQPIQVIEPATGVKKLRLEDECLEATRKHPLRFDGFEFTDFFSSLMELQGGIAEQPDRKSLEQHSNPIIDREKGVSITIHRGTSNKWAPAETTRIEVKNLEDPTKVEELHYTMTRYGSGRVGETGPDVYQQNQIEPPTYPSNITGQEEPLLRKDAMQHVRSFNLRFEGQQFCKNILAAYQRAQQDAQNPTQTDINNALGKITSSRREPPLEDTPCC